MSGTTRKLAARPSGAGGRMALRAHETASSEMKTSANKNIGVLERELTLPATLPPLAPAAPAPAPASANEGVWGKNRVWDFFSADPSSPRASRAASRDSRRACGSRAGKKASAKNKPDFVAFNSNNRRYHYPARTYIPFRSSYVQLDPIYRIFFAGRFLVTAQRESLYLIAKSRPTHAVDSLGLITAEECESAKEAARLLTAGCPKPATCPPPEILCVCCDANAAHRQAIGSPSAFAGLVTEGPFEGSILICTDRLTTVGASTADTLRVVLHEMVHALDYCVNGLIGCTDIACSEVRAYAQSGMCSDPDSLWLKSTGGDPVKCIEQWASASVASHPECATQGPGPSGIPWVRLVWDTCAVSNASSCFTRTPGVR